MTRELLRVAAIWTASSAIAVAVQPVITEGPEFDGIDESASNPEVPPGDPDIAVGHDLIIQAVNHWMRMWAFNEGEDEWVVVGNVDLSDFLDSTETVATDPRVIFDPASERFFVCAYGEVEIMGGDAERNILVAVSEPESEIVAVLDDLPPGDNPFQDALWTPVEPLQGFFPQFTSSQPPFAGECATGNTTFEGALLVDQPALGWYSGGVILSAYLGGFDTRDNVFYVIDREPNQQAEFDVVGPLFGNDFPDGAGELGCSDVLGFGYEKALPIKGSESYDAALFVGLDWNAQTQTCENAGLLDTFILYSFNDPFGDPDDRGLARVTVNCFDQPGCVETEGEEGMDPETELPLNANDARITSAQVLLEGDDEILWLTHSIGTGAQSLPVSRWFRIDLNGWPESPTAQPLLDASGNVAPIGGGSPAGMGRFFPSGFVDPATGTLGLVWVRSAPSETASVRFGARLSNGTLMTPNVVIQSPVGDTPGDDNGDCSRWGDYSDIELDPDDGTFWVTGVYMKEGGDSETEEEWGSYIANRGIDN